MDTAPTDGSRILAQVQLYSYKQGENGFSAFHAAGTRWVECRMHENAWEEWSGGDYLESSGRRVHALMWMPLPPDATPEAPATVPPMTAALLAYEEAFAGLFAQCCSNPVTNAWGKPVNMSALNDAHQLAERALRDLPLPEGAPVPWLKTSKAWHFSNEGRIVIRDENHNIVAQGGYMGELSEVREGYLLAAAPRLLNALIGLAQICGSAVMAGTVQGRNAAAAIAAARGVEQ